MICCITDAMSKLLQLVDIDKALALAGTIKFHRPVSKPGSGNRFEISPNFRVPGLTPDRPTSVEGRVAFCLVHTVVMKEANYGAAGSRMQRYAVVSTSEGRTISTSASAFDRYICRESAVLKVYPEADKGRREGNTAAAAPAIFTNIHLDQEVRDEFWEAVTRCGRNPSPDIVNLYPERLSEEQWAEIIDNYDGPPALMDALLRVQADLFVRIQPQPGGKNGTVSLKMRKRDFVEFRKHLRKMGAWDQNHPPASLKRGYSARIQRRLIAELPVGLTDSAMFLIAQEFASYLGKKQLMYTVVVHAPDAHNDRRNYHLHAVAYDRPCKFLEEHGCWDFEYREPVPGQSNRMRFPHRQNKPRLPSSTKNVREQRIDEIMEFREVYAAICNEQLLKCGINRLFDHRSYKEMGIAQVPGRRISQRDSLLEAAGIPTAIGTDNAEKSWQGEFDRAVEAHRLRQEQRLPYRERARAALTKAHLAKLNSPAARELDQQLRHFDELGERELVLAKLELTHRMACSRAEKTFEVCQRLIDSIESGTAKATDLKWEDEIRDRQQAAEDHLDLIDAVMLGQIEAVRDLNCNLPEQVQEAMLRMQTLVVEVEKEAWAIVPRQDNAKIPTASGDATPSSSRGLRDARGVFISEQDGLPVRLEPQQAVAPSSVDTGPRLKNLAKTVDAALGATRTALADAAKRILGPSEVEFAGPDYCPDHEIEIARTDGAAVVPVQESRAGDASPDMAMNPADVSPAEDPLTCEPTVKTEQELDWLALHLANHLDTEQAHKTRPVRRRKPGWQLETAGLSPHFQEIAAQVADHPIIIAKINEFKDGYERKIREWLNGDEPVLKRTDKGLEIVRGKMPPSLEIHIVDLFKHDESFRRHCMIAVQHWEKGSLTQASKSSVSTGFTDPATTGQKFQSQARGAAETDEQEYLVQQAWIASGRRGNNGYSQG